MINIVDWFWIYRRKCFGGVVVGFYKIFSIWIVRDGFEFTIAKPSYHRIMHWWRKYSVEWHPVGITTYRQ